MDSHAPRAGTDSVRYGALLHALWSIRGPDHFEAVEPSVEALPYRVDVPRGVAPLLDVYLPEAHAHGASVLLVHGGGFVLGHRRMKPMRALAARFVRGGFAVFSVDYRLLFRGGRLDEAVDDVRVALRFCRERAGGFGLDPSRVSMVGLSAGGTLAMLVAGLEPGAVHRLACCFGLYEIDHLQGPLAGLLPTLLLGTTSRATWASRSPLAGPQSAAPTLLLHGTDDGLVPVSQARRLLEHRQAARLPTRLVEYAGAPHGFFNFPCEAGSAAAEELVRHLSEDEPGPA